jgi:hypothetical protein
MKFSQRIGKTPSAKQMQVEGIDDELRNGLWNALQIYLFNSIERRNQYSLETEYQLFLKILWLHFYKLPMDRIPDRSESFIRDRFFNCTWFEVYDFLEFVAGLNPNTIHIEIHKFKEFCNDILEREFAGYRFIDDHIAPITNEKEIQEIEQALQHTGQFSSFKGANIHLAAALEKLSDKKSPDYRNSIKESISAIESLAKVISTDTKDTLGGALDKIKGKIKIHQALEKGFKQLYGYTSDGDGIRHALMENPNCDFEDAKYMLVSSSAFINYLLTKADKAGIKFK